MRTIVGLSLLLLILLGGGRACWRFLRPQLRSTQIRKAKNHRGMIDIPLARDIHEDLPG